MPATLTALLLLVAIAASAQNMQGSSENRQPQLDGTITGVVTNNEGESILGASLCTEIYYDHGSGTSCGGTQTDAQGRFSVRVPLGEIGILAEKMEAGYWPASHAMRTPTPGHTIGMKMVTLTREASTATVKLKIGPRPATLKFSVKDKSTGKSVEVYHVRWIGVDNQMMSGFGHQISRAASYSTRTQWICTRS